MATRPVTPRPAGAYRCRQIVDQILHKSFFMFFVFCAKNRPLRCRTAMAHAMSKCYESILLAIATATMTIKQITTATLAMTITIAAATTAAGVATAAALQLNQGRRSTKAPTMPSGFAWQGAINNRSCLTLAFDSPKSGSPNKNRHWESWKRSNAQRSSHDCIPSLLFFLHMSKNYMTSVSTTRDPRSYPG